MGGGWGKKETALYTMRCTATERLLFYCLGTSAGLACAVGLIISDQNVIGVVLCVDFQFCFGKGFQVFFGQLAEMQRGRFVFSTVHCDSPSFAVIMMQAEMF